MKNVQLLTNAQIRALGLKAGKARVTDLKTMREYDIFWGGAPTNHTDFSPFTPADTEIMRQISGGWSWLARPVVLHIKSTLYGEHNLAAGVHHFPHAMIIGGNPGLPNKSNTRPPGGWEIGVHMCMYYKDSTGGTSGMVEAAAEAFGMVQSLDDIPALGSNIPASSSPVSVPDSLEEVKAVTASPEKRYDTIEEMPDWARTTIKGLVDNGILRSDGRGLNLSEDMIRVFVVHGRMGLYGVMGAN